MKLDNTFDKFSIELIHLPNSPNIIDVDLESKYNYNFDIVINSKIFYSIENTFNGIAECMIDRIDVLFNPNEEGFIISDAAIPEPFFVIKKCENGVELDIQKKRQNERGKFLKNVSIFKVQLPVEMYHSALKSFYKQLFSNHHIVDYCYNSKSISKLIELCV